MPSIEDIILAHDRRGISKLRRYFPSDFCRSAANFVLEQSGTVLIVTGFYIPDAHTAETDGLVGALALGRALESLGNSCYYISDGDAAQFLCQAVNPEKVIAVPLMGHQASRQFAAALLDKLCPQLLIAIERPGVTADGTYRTMRGQDISEFTAKLDYLFVQHPRTVAIGDGGNEIGMGNVWSEISRMETPLCIPSITCATHLIISSVSNWGAYGLLAAMCDSTGKDLLPGEAEEAQMIRLLVELGAVDGVVGQRQETVDTFTVAENAAVLRGLRDLMDLYQR